MTWTIPDLRRAIEVLRIGNWPAFLGEPPTGWRINGDNRQLADSYRQQFERALAGEQSEGEFSPVARIET